MFSPRLAAFAAISTLVGSVTAAFEIFEPGPNSWWIAKSENVLGWTCNDSAPALEYTVLLNNTNTSVLAAPLAILAPLSNSDCTESISQDKFSLPVGDGYTVLFASYGNQSEILATSQPFEIKAQGSQYPSSTTISTHGPATSTTNTTGSSTGTSTSVSKSNGASATFKMSAAGVLAAVGAAIGML